MFTEVTLTPLSPPWDKPKPKVQNVTVPLGSMGNKGATVQFASSAVLSHGQYFHTGEAVGVFGQHHRVAVHTDLIETQS